MTSPTLPADALVATCEACHQQVHPGDGYLWINLGEVKSLRRAARDWRAQHTGAAFTIEHLLTMPGPARWRVHHSACDPNSDGGTYSIEIEKVQTGRDLLWWTAHLMQKTWFTATDWQQLIEGVTHGAGFRLRIASAVRS